METIHRSPSVCSFPLSHFLHLFFFMNHFSSNPTRFSTSVPHLSFSASLSCPYFWNCPCAHTFSLSLIHYWCAGYLTVWGSWTVPVCVRWSCDKENQIKEDGSANSLVRDFIFIFTVIKLQISWMLLSTDWSLNVWFYGTGKSNFHRPPQNKSQMFSSIQH